MQKVRELTGSDVERYDFSIDRDAVRHVLKEHGNPKVEAARGQRAVTSADYALLPQLLSEADEVTEAGSSRTTGRKLVRFVWDRGFEQWEAVMEIRDAKRTLALTKLFVRETRRP